MNVRTRFAPSPSGDLHLGGARTALFNWLLSKSLKGEFFLRIEDTNAGKSHEHCVESIVQGLSWLGIVWDQDIVYQHKNVKRHGDLARQLLKEGKAYLCYASPEDLLQKRMAQKAAGLSQHYESPWRDTQNGPAPHDHPVIRFRSPKQGKTIIEDLIQGPVTLANSQLDDMILLRADGTPTYMLSAVVDDHDMDITHVVRGDDHLTNTFRHYHLFQALGFQVPQFAHIPLIYNERGEKLSKRQGAQGILVYKDQGFLPQALINYILRLGWSHNNNEIISLEQAIQWFSLKDVGKSPARLDQKKLQALNSHYMKQACAPALLERFADVTMPGVFQPIVPEEKAMILKAIDLHKERCSTLVHLYTDLLVYLDPPKQFSRDVSNVLYEGGDKIFDDLIIALNELDRWSAQEIETLIKHYMHQKKLKMNQVAPVLRGALLNSCHSPSIFHIIACIGKENTLKRLSFARDHLQLWRQNYDRDIHIS